MPHQALPPKPRRTVSMHNVSTTLLYSTPPQQEEEKKQKLEKAYPSPMPLRNVSTSCIQAPNIVSCFRNKQTASSHAHISGGNHGNVCLSNFSFFSPLAGWRNASLTVLAQVLYMVRMSSDCGDSRRWMYVLGTCFAVAFSENVCRSLKLFLSCGILPIPRHRS